MSNDTKEKLLSTTAPTPPVQNYEEEDDGLATFSLEQLGQKVSAFGGARLLKFVSGSFVTREGEIIDSNREFILLGLVKVVQKFVGKKLVETIVVPTREKFPDVDKMNEAAPREEWGTDLNGKSVGPYVRVLVLKLLDAATMDRYAFVTSSMGGKVAFGDISDKVKLVRRLKGAHVTVAVTCEAIKMKSSYNPHGVPRPHFRIVRYVALGDGAPLPPALAPKTLHLRHRRHPRQHRHRRQRRQQLRLRSSICRRYRSRVYEKKWRTNCLFNMNNKNLGRRMRAAAVSVSPFPNWGRSCASSISTPKPIAQSTSQKQVPIFMPGTRPQMSGAYPIVWLLMPSAARSRFGGKAIQCRKKSSMSPTILTL